MQQRTEWQNETFGRVRAPAASSGFGNRARLATAAETEAPPGLAWAHLQLPPFPQVAVRVLQLMHDENVQLHDLADMVSSDPVFAGEVLSVANSVLYSPRYPASSIFQAIAVLGATTLQGVCVTVGARAYMGRAMNQPAMRGLWRHNMACAVIARRLASAGSCEEGVAYTSGMMHDLGRLALATIQPREYALLLASHNGPPASILDRERDLFGCDHCETGLQLIGKWNLPPEFDAIIAGHHHPRADDRAWDMTELVCLSCKMADAIGFTAFQGCETSGFDQLLEELPDRERKLFTANPEVLASEVTECIHAIECG